MRGRVRIWLEIVLILALSLVGMVLGGLSGWLVLGPLCGVALPIAAASLILRRQGRSWRDLGFARSMPVGRFGGYTLAALAAVFLINNLIVSPLMQLAGAPPPDLSILKGVIAGNLGNYLLFLIPVSWGSAAVGEELIARAFLFDRFASLYPTGVAIVLQAAIFALAHFYQGPTGIANVFVIALVFGLMYVRCGRNLWPVIAAHGVIDTVGVTALYLGWT